MWQKFCDNWLPWVGMLFIFGVIVPLSGCLPETAPRGVPTTIESTEIAVPKTATEDPRLAVPIESTLPPAGAEEGHLGNPDVIPDLTPSKVRDPEWDCSPTGNTAIDDWKREAKCGGKLDGE